MQSMAERMLAGTHTHGVVHHYALPLGPKTRNSVSVFLSLPGTRPEFRSASVKNAGDCSVTL